ncbi:hypothetical protein ABEY96_28215 [Priestia aryabhattai]|uniref:hypothetical protein n=1 Tax=Priestia aryabhattai TaxID=412384 RepID=UPI003D2D54D6
MSEFKPLEGRCSRMEQKIGYFAKQAAEQVGVNTNTLRRWALELEKNDYEFQRNDKGREGQRIYYQKDINALIQFKNILARTHDVENTAKLVIEGFEEVVNTEKAHSVHAQDKRSNGVQIVFSEEEFKQYTRSLIEETSARVAQEVSSKVAAETSARVATETAEAIYKKMGNLLEQRDHRLLNSLTESMEQRRLEVAASKEEPSFWSRIFGKKNS